METDGTYESRDTRGKAVPGPSSPPGTPAARVPAADQTRAAPPAYPAAPPDLARKAGPGFGQTPPGIPPMPSRAPGRTETATPSPVVEWLDAPRPMTGLGVWRFRYVPPSEEAARLKPVTLLGLLIPLIVALFIWLAYRNDNLPYAAFVMRTFTPNEWWTGLGATAKDWQGVAVHAIFDAVVFFGLVWVVGVLGSWGKIIRYYLERSRPPVRAALAGVGAVVGLAFVLPEALHLGWSAVPVVNPMLYLIALVTGGWDIAGSPVVIYAVYVLSATLIVWPCAQVGEWANLFRQWRSGGGPLVPSAPAPQSGPGIPCSQWPELRAAGEDRAADVLAGDLAAGRMNDVDCARVRRAWKGSEGDAARRTAFVDAVLREGAGAGAHPSGDRNVSSRSAAHDLLLGQVRVGRWVAAERGLRAYHGAGLALDTALLGTSLLAVGPSGAGKTRSLVAPVVESLSLQALTGACAVVAVGGAGAALGPDEAYDVVIRLGDPASAYDLDLYAGATDPDEAADCLAEGLVGDVEGVETRRAATVLAQLIGPYRVAYGRFPTVPVLRELLEAHPETLRALLDLLPVDGAQTMRRELESRLRQIGTASDVGPVLADRLAALDRPAFADFFGGGGDARSFSLRAVAQHPIRVRVSLPEGGHEEAACLLNRLLIAQFQRVTRGGAERGNFACLVLDDAAGAVTPGTLRAFQRLRTQNAGVVLALRTLAEVPEALHGPLLAIVGCRMAFAGLPTWDGRAFAEAWGTEHVDTTEVAHHTVFADQPMTRAIHALRKLVTGKAVTTEAVTVRQVERMRWSASDLAHAVPPGHAVLSLSHVRGEQLPPMLVDLRA
ncbi:ATP/GTP-binding protein [Streptomyces sp. NPDC096079]|uniref:ATP/GTP-binding protein n=1 Tax=Streptomyces sp. NPDC096079 TaxID=3155820 RepID=UPI0033269B2E